jgi:hypothetical protein
MRLRVTWHIMGAGLAAALALRTPARALEVVEVNDGIVRLAAGLATCAIYFGIRPLF